MQLLETLSIDAVDGRKRQICLYQGDLTQIPPQERVDVLVVSAFPGSYAPLPGTLIGAISQNNHVSVKDLASDKMLDMTEHFACWMSKSLVEDNPNIGYKHILCFEPGQTSLALNRAIGDAFRSLIPALFEYECRQNEGATSIALPLLAAGNQGFDARLVAEAILDAAAHWLHNAAPVDTVRLVERDPGKAQQARAAFKAVRANLAGPSIARSAGATRAPKKFDVFISYSRKDEAIATLLASRLKAAGLTVFIDQNSIDVGRSWQQEIFESLDDTRKVLVLYSPAYFASVVCKEEFNVAYALERKRRGVLVPLYLRSTTLATYIELINFIDAREGDAASVDKIWQRLLQAVADPKQKTNALATTATPAIVPTYLAGNSTWQQRCNDWLTNQADPFVSANAAKLTAILGDREGGARIVVNMGSYALLQLDRPDQPKYLNAYDLAVIGVKGPVDGTRQRVDALICPKGKNPDNIYFGAVALESTGVRFYGEYCVVLKPSDADVQIFERDSYELVFEPLGNCTDKELQVLAAKLKGTWNEDLESMATLKVRELLPEAGRLVTEGRFRDALLRGEEYIEVHRIGSFSLMDVEEVRQAPDDIALESQVERAFECGVLPKLEELVWCSRRAAVEVALAQRGLDCRLVGGQGVR